MKQGEWVIVRNEFWGYSHVDPLPSDAELGEFYANQYYELIAKGGRAPELRRLQGGGQAAEEEREWLACTLWSDIRHIAEGLLESQNGKTILDVGCGPGHFAVFMRESGWSAAGVEVSVEARRDLREQGIEAYGSLTDVPPVMEGSFSLVTLINVLEHVRKPFEMVSAVRPLMAEDSLLVIRVPNDFSETQECAQKRIEKDPWWIAVPDHVNYFNFQSLQTFLAKLDFEVVHMTTDFPMEIFLLMGDDYTSDSTVGAACHARRKALEMGLSQDLRRRLYCCFAQQGIGRNCLCFARKLYSSAH